MRAFVVTVLSAAFAMFALAAEMPKTNHAADFAKHWKTAGDYTIAIAEQMPAESYSFKPVPEEMSFAEQMVHICNANGYFLKTLTGDTPPEKPSAMDKDTVLKFMRASFDWTNTELAKVTPDQMMKSYKMEGQDMSGIDVLELASNHTTHHRGQCIVYLRLKGIKPTDYRF